ncbi:14510_t:CDS:1, partial [Racocetra persica]
MNDLILNGGNIDEEVFCNDPDKDFEILDDFSIGDNSESLEQPTTSSLSSVHSLNNVDNKIQNNLCNLHFDKTAVEVAKAYANSASQIIQEQYEEVDVNWLSPELNATIDSDSLWEGVDHQESEFDIELNSVKVKYVNSTCVIIDNSNGKLQQCSEPVSKPLRQLGGVWELDFETVNQIVMVSKKDNLSSLGICASHFNYDNKQLHTFQKSEVSIEKSLVHRKKCLFCGSDKYIFSRGGYCREHSWKLFDRNIQIMCNGLTVCPVFQKNDFAE